MSASRIYIHVPFCRVHCHYCDFYVQAQKQTDEERLDRFAQAVIDEIRSKKEHLSFPLKSIYFGGGTPSLLGAERITSIINYVMSLGALSQNHEITVEVNPYKLDKNFFERLLNGRVNRLSIGIQSLNPTLLQFLDREHTADEALEVVAAASDAGFSNLSVDLLYGVPSQMMSDLKNDVERLFQNKAVNHLSAYCLTLLPSNPHYKSLPTSDEAFNQLESLKSQLLAHGLEQYEVSNFAKPGCEAQHNSAYWKLESYLGIGPSSASLLSLHDQPHVRIKNSVSLNTYLKSTPAKDVFDPSRHTVEQLSSEESQLEVLYLSFRAQYGLDLAKWEQIYNEAFLNSARKVKIENLLKSGHIIEDKENTRLLATPKLWPVLDEAIKYLL